jgi:hypothetical protein
MVIVMYAAGNACVFEDGEFLIQIVGLKRETLPAKPLKADMEQSSHSAIRRRSILIGQMDPIEYKQKESHALIQSRKKSFATAFISRIVHYSVG